MSTAESRGVGTMRPPFKSVLLLAPAVCFVAVFFLWPLAMLLLRSVTEPVQGLQNYTELLGDRTFIYILLQTLLFSTTIMLSTLVIGFPVAWFITIAPNTASSVMLGTVVLSMWSSALARVYAWLVILQDNGPINKLLMNIGLVNEPVPLVHNTLGSTIGMTYIMLPFMIMPIYGTLRTIEPSLMSAASVCGAKAFYIFRRILLPLAAPGIGTGCIVVFVLSLGYFIVPAMLGSAQQILMSGFVYSQVQSQLNWGIGGAAALILLAVTLVFYGIYYAMIRPDLKI